MKIHLKSLLIIGFLLILPNVAYGASLTDPWSVSCPTYVGAESCGTDYVNTAAPSALTCAPLATMTARNSNGLNGCTDIGSPNKGTLKCNGTCTWTSSAVYCDPLNRNTTTLTKSLTGPNGTDYSPAPNESVCGSCKAGFTDYGAGSPTMCDPVFDDVMVNQATDPDTYYAQPVSGPPVEITIGGADLWTTDDGTNVWRAAGKVGIGTATPAVPLDVVVTSGGAATLGSVDASATGKFATALGGKVLASGESSLAVGDATYAATPTTASGKYSLSVGYSGLEQNIASGDESVALGWQCTASGQSSFCQGSNSEATAFASRAMGNSSSATANSATAIGYGTTASGASSVALNENTLASGNFTTAMGYGTTAQAYRSTVVGTYNVVIGDKTTWVATEPLFVVGNGYDDGTIHPSNAFTVLKNGYTGIGNASPNSMLQINNNVGVSGFNAWSDYQILLYEGASPNTSYGIGVESSTLAFNTNNDVVFYENGTARMKIDNANVGIGTTSPGAGLHIKRDGWPSSFMFLDTNASGQDAGIRIYENGVVKHHIYNSSTYDNLIIEKDGGPDINIGSYINLNGNTKVNATSFDLNEQSKTLNTWFDMYAQNGYSNYLDFIESDGTAIGEQGFQLNYYGASDRFYIRSFDDHNQLNNATVRMSLERLTGDVGIGLSDPAYRFHVYDGGCGGNCVMSRFQGATGNVDVYGDGWLVISGNARKPGAGSWLDTSDIRLKDVKSGFGIGLEAINQINPIVFSYKKDNPYNYDASAVWVGASAQEVQKVIPQAISSDDKGYLQLSLDPVIWASVNAIKELKAENDALKDAVCEIKPSAEICNQ